MRHYPLTVIQSVWRRLAARKGVRERGEAIGVTSGCNVVQHTSTEIKPWVDRKLGEEPEVSRSYLGESPRKRPSFSDACGSSITARKSGYSGSWPRWVALQDGRVIINAFFKRRKDALHFGRLFETTNVGSSYRELRPLALKCGAYYVQ